MPYMDPMGMSNTYYVSQTLNVWSICLHLSFKSTWMEPSLYESCSCKGNGHTIPPSLDRNTWNQSIIFPERTLFQLHLQKKQCTKLAYKVGPLPVINGVIMPITRVVTPVTQSYPFIRLSKGVITPFTTGRGPPRRVMLPVINWSKLLAVKALRWACSNADLASSWRPCCESKASWKHHFQALILVSTALRGSLIYVFCIVFSDIQYLYSINIH